MTETQLFEELLGQWGAGRAGSIEEVESLRDADLDYRIAPDARSVRELAEHMAQSTLLFSTELTRPDGDFARQPLSAFYAEYARGLPPARTVADLAALLRSTWEKAESALRDAGPELLTQSMRGMMGQTATKSSIVVFAINHEFYHRGQLALCVRACGHIPALTRRLAALG